MATRGCGPRTSMRSPRRARSSTGFTLARTPPSRPGRTFSRGSGPSPIRSGVQSLRERHCFLRSWQGRDTLRYASVDTPFYMREGFGYDRGFDVFVENYGQNMFNRAAFNQRIVRGRQFEEDYFAPGHSSRPATILGEEPGEREAVLHARRPLGPPRAVGPSERGTRSSTSPTTTGGSVLPTYSRVEEGRIDPEDIETAHACYCGEITMVDRWLGTFLRRWKTWA